MGVDFVLSKIAYLVLAILAVRGTYTPIQQDIPRRQLLLYLETQ